MFNIPSTVSCTSVASLIQPSGVLYIIAVVLEMIVGWPMVSVALQRQ